jgi:hypothetical protein
MGFCPTGMPARSGAVFDNLAGEVDTDRRETEGGVNLFQDDTQDMYEKFFKKADFGLKCHRNPNRCYRLTVPRISWDTAGHGMKCFLENVDFRPNRRRNLNDCYRLTVPRDPWDTAGRSFLGVEPLGVEFFGG